MSENERDVALQEALQEDAEVIAVESADDEPKTCPDCNGEGEITV